MSGSAQAASLVVSQGLQQGATSVFQPAYSAENYVTVLDTSMKGYAMPQEYLAQRNQVLGSAQPYVRNQSVTGSGQIPQQTMFAPMTSQLVPSVQMTAPFRGAPVSGPPQMISQAPVQIARGGGSVSALPAYTSSQPGTPPPIVSFPTPGTQPAMVSGAYTTMPASGSGMVYATNPLYGPPMSTMAQYPAFTGPVSKDRRRVSCCP
mmetsp:Transcript_45065/g.97863  ORF Transcript_45065/g.97863 Transcript_45065/m.97863 type:complete len:206 (+) Transcript_45065:54-671(+)|eukprot:CAMPEP_0204275522 /NCGR_PEP_ID=MMETSP0468-20130131/26150_1 /ASSEMBLY_ACC=CAM_ASM_000383 /TAXON_ID=2969 /ORGANISM="Oxyrrhis marina" /LENGTH=205 /DNA_ID=CAMNT_0051251873 /DNA_START=37 /DNA_END=654 /DNA_ORIENTATION=+